MHKIENLCTAMTLCRSYKAIRQVILYVNRVLEFLNFILKTNVCLICN